MNDKREPKLPSEFVPAGLPWAIGGVLFDHAQQVGFALQHWNGCARFRMGMAAGIESAPCLPVTLSFSSVAGTVDSTCVEFVRGGLRRPGSGAAREVGGVAAP